jgi:citronellyl-CoA dehydrogenase
LFCADAGGSGLDFSYAVAISEELGQTVNCGGVPMAIGVQSILVPFAIAKFGSDKLKNEFVAPTMRGELIGCLGVSEPGAGSDVSNIQTRAVEKGDDLLITGSKMWISNGMQADWMVCLANTSDAKQAGGRHRNKSLIAVPLNVPGVQRTKIHKIGMHSSDTALFHFDEVRVPKSHIIGGPGMGFLIQMLQFQEERIWSCAVALGPLERAIRETIEYTRNRKTFGKPILDNQFVHFRLAEMQTEIEAARSLLYRVVARYVAGQDATELVSMCKLKLGKMCRTIPDECLQFWGGMGYTADVNVSRIFRDSRLLPIGAGTDEMMMMIICKYMNILPKDALGDLKR